MRAEYTIRASVIYEIRVMAEDEDDALEKAIGYKFTSWHEVDAEFFVEEVEPVTLSPRDPHADD